MQTPLRIDFESLKPSTALRAGIARQANRLEHFAPRLVGCHVVVSEPHRHHRRGRQYQVHVHLKLPGGEIAVSRDGRGVAHDDPYLAVRDAFRQAQRQLEDFVRVRRGDVKTRRRPVRARLPERL
jgi:ribosome-associated translation inhibitor RaiA